MTARFHDREPERKEEGDEKRLLMRLVPFRELGGHGRSVAFLEGSLGRDAVLGGLALLDWYDRGERRCLVFLQ